MTSTAQARRPGRLVRSTHHAAAVPITAQHRVVTTARRTVFQRSVAVSPRNSRLEMDVSPTWPASTRRNTTGTSSRTATSTLVSARARGVRERRIPLAGRPTIAASATAIDTPAFCSDQLRLLEQADGRGAVPQLGDRDGIRLQR